MRCVWRHGIAQDGKVARSSKRCATIFRSLDAWFWPVGLCAPRAGRRLDAMGSGPGKEIGEWMDLTCRGRVSTDRGATRLPAKRRDGLLLPTVTHRIFGQAHWCMDDHGAWGSRPHPPEATIGFFLPSPRSGPHHCFGGFFMTALLHHGNEESTDRGGTLRVDPARPRCLDASMP